jgi:hypothetical protein
LRRDDGGDGGRPPFPYSNDSVKNDSVIKLLELVGEVAFYEEDSKRDASSTACGETPQPRGSLHFEVELETHPEIPTSPVLAD